MHSVNDRLEQCQALRGQADTGADYNIGMFADAKCLFSHLAMSETGEGASWGEQVSDTEYKMGPAAN